MTSLSLPVPDFRDGRGLYPETLRADVPRGLTEIIKAAAALEGIGKSEFIRRAIAARLNATCHHPPVSEDQ
jgi:hypothetical protein